MNKDLLSGIVLLAVAALYHWGTGFISDSTLSDEVGATGLPRVLTVALVLISLLIIVRALLARQPIRQKTAPSAESEVEDDASLPRAIGFLMFGAAYVFLLPFLGYIACVALLIGAVALFEGAARTWTVPVAAIGGAVLYWAIFVKLLGVNQPGGILFQRFFA
jgi:putative tricarboxylic transport membrane protein